MSQDLQSINAKIILACVVGLGLSVYALIVEKKLEVDENYEPLCDIAEKMKCSVAFSSTFGKGFGIFQPGSFLYKPNSIFGIIHYCITMALGMTNKPVLNKVLVAITLLSNIACVYFAFVLFFILYDFCIVCVSVYIVNLYLFYLAVRKLKASSEKTVKTD